jgi:accessory gene regulator protein AgrB
MQIFQGLKSWGKTFLYVVVAIITQFWQLAGVVVISLYNNRPRECLFLLIGFWIGRRFFGDTYHAPTMVICTIITWVTFYFLTSGVPSFHISITMPCIFGVLLAFALSTVSGLIERGKKDD